MMTLSVTMNQAALAIATNAPSRNRRCARSARPNPMAMSGSSSFTRNEAPRQIRSGTVLRLARKYIASPSGSTASVISWKS